MRRVIVTIVGCAVAAAIAATGVAVSGTAAVVRPDGTLPACCVR